MLILNITRYASSNLAGCSFTRLVEYPESYVDKTLFIKDFTENSNQILLLTFPKRSGKSVIAEMTQKFFEIEVDKQGNRIPEAERKNRKLFLGDQKLYKKLNIAETTINSKDPQSVLGEFPVVYVDFAGVRNRTGILTSLSYAFSGHLYMLRVLENKLNTDGVDKTEREVIESHIEKFRRIATYSDQNVKDEDIQSGLAFLAQLLHEHFREKVIVIVDEYDTPFHRLAFEGAAGLEELSELADLVGSMYEALFKDKSSIVEKGLITGVVRIAKDTLFNDIRMDEYDYFRGHFSKYYGFSEVETMNLLSNRQVSKEKLKEVRLWYDGYGTTSGDLYNIWSIVEYLSHQCRASHYWSRSETLSGFEEILYLQHIRDPVKELVSGSIISFAPKPYLQLDDYAKLKSMTQLTWNSTSVTVEDSQIFFTFLNFFGYLTSARANFTQFRIPNKDVKHEIAKVLQNHYWDKLNLHYQEIKTLQALLEEMIITTNEGRDKAKAEFASYLCEVLVSNEAFDESRIEQLVYAILTVINMEVSNGEFGDHIFADFYVSDRKEDVLIRTYNNIGVVMELSCDRVEKKAQKQRLISYINGFKKPEVQYRYTYTIQKLLYLGIRVSRLRNCEIVMEDAVVDLQTSNVSWGKKIRRIRKSQSA